MWQRSSLMQELVQEAADARQEDGQRSTQVHCTALLWTALYCLLGCWARQAAGMRLLELQCLPAQAPEPVWQTDGDDCPACWSLLLLRLGFLQARRGAVSLQDSRHVRALTASEQLASTRFQVGRVYFCAVQCIAVQGQLGMLPVHLSRLPICSSAASAKLVTTRPSSCPPLQMRRAPGCIELIYMFDGDKNGVCWHLGTRGGTQPWVNPVLGGQLQVGC